MIAVDRPFEKLLTTKEVAAWLDTPVSTLWGWRSKGQGPRAMKLGRELRYKREDVEAWLEEQSRG